ncbi:MAG: Rpn family recombination-promoting nuclease/putative transposase [Terrimicrobiaceae bacterium]
MRYLDPKNDLTFKKVFGEHPRLLMSFLNAMLPLEPGREVVEIEYLPAELVPEIPQVRNSIVDVRCRASDGRQFIVEMQMLWTESFQQRVLFNASKAYVRQIRPGHEYRLLQPVYSLNLLNDTYLPPEEGWYHHYRITEVQGTGRVIEGLEFVFIELPKFTPQTFTEKKLRALWLRFLTEVGENAPGDPPAELFAEPEVRDAVEMMRVSAFSEEELAAYEKYWDGVSVERTVRVDAYAEGEAATKLAMAAAMLREGIPVDQVAKISGLPVEILKAIAR